jgi:hypothetical protein
LEVSNLDLNTVAADIVSNIPAPPAPTMKKTIDKEGERGQSMAAEVTQSVLENLDSALSNLRKTFL